jgi:hypothetical protein
MQLLELAYLLDQVFVRSPRWHTPQTQPQWLRCTVLTVLSARLQHMSQRLNSFSSSSSVAVVDAFPDGDNDSRDSFSRTSTDSPAPDPALLHILHELWQQGTPKRGVDHSRELHHMISEVVWGAEVLSQVGGCG